jgi:RNA polymerase sigma-70 factor (ECF subfamily)
MARLERGGSMPQGRPDLTPLLERLREGDSAAREELAAAVYQELRQLARRQMRGEDAAHTLQPTALVHEAYLRLLSGPRVINGRTHFFALAAQAMRRVLVDHARRKGAGKRGGAARRVTLDHLETPASDTLDVLELDDALLELERLEPRLARVVELRFFGGHTDSEVCEILGENMARVRRDWAFARAWLRQRLTPAPGGTARGALAHDA